ncbi:hypothetical protein NXS19_000102 [Fusarium pseudograminearum]|nr:hypothetical protein FPSE5266_12026 [Fusarium pseudograminearum]UZP32286.1 hypothetical protein NXS19_000102 [Fusarium pseudograminearum]
MRVLLFATGLFAANVVVEAGVCKPAHTTASHSDAVSSIESSATSASATVIETVSLSTTETTSAEATETTAPGTTLVTTTSVEIISTSVTEAPTTTTTEEASTTVSSSSAPYFTPGSVVGTGPVAGLTLQGDGQRFIPLSFQQSGSAQTLIFSIVNGKLATGINNNYLCLNYKDEGVLGPLVLCPFDNFENAPLSCQQSSDGTLACTAPNGSCNSSGTCRRPNAGVPFSQFYVNDAQEGFFGPASGDFAGYTALNLVLAK